ncbi:hypothetical protein K470DRAFT_270628 [Piedraia hortae CBS 480.64]|uniref:Uncharacterized protein n=1 Tax=Piedraia hortae CBS 480.64 TaxID=1314780 RepID=A0A6A7BZG1_9PEZI|nr:hypothetical protein K470DRAFT_270628 [Piedraia hortae CBS 480.64]
MLDENLPTFYLSGETVLFAINGEEPRAVYSLVGNVLRDAYFSDIIYGELGTHQNGGGHAGTEGDDRGRGDGSRVGAGVGVSSGGGGGSGGSGSKATLSNNAVPERERSLPHPLAITLHNPPLIVPLTHTHTLLREHYTFSLPSQTFRHPSPSALDLTLPSPGELDTTPRVSFTWRERGWGWGCYLSPSTPGSGMPRGKEPPILVAFAKGKEVTFYESNWKRVEVEDWKGLEVVLIISAFAVINAGAAGRDAAATTTGAGLRRRVSFLGRATGGGGGMLRKNAIPEEHVDVKRQEERDRVLAVKLQRELDSKERRTREEELRRETERLRKEFGAKKSFWGLRDRAKSEGQVQKPTGMVKRSKSFFGLKDGK